MKPQSGPESDLTGALKGTENLDTQRDITGVCTDRTL